MVAMVALLLSSCDDDAELFTVSGGPTAAVLAQLNITDIELDPVVTNNPAATFSWTPANYGLQASVIYSVQFSSDEAFTNAYTATTVTGGSSVTLSVSELNSAAGSSGLAPFAWSALYARVVSSLGTQSSQTVASNVITFNVYPYFNYVFDDYYLVGDGTAPGWNNNNNNPPIFRDGSNADLFHYEGYFSAGHFKLLEVKGLWQPQWGTNDGATIEANPGGGSDPERFPLGGGAGITVAGYYKFTINFSSNTFTWEPYDASGATDFTSMTLQGSGVAAPVSMSQSSFDSHLWYANGVRLTPGDVQFLTNTGGTWGSDTSFSGQATAGGSNIPVVVEDDYDVWFSDLTGRYILIPLNL